MTLCMHPYNGELSNTRLNCRSFYTLRDSQFKSYDDV